MDTHMNLFWMKYKIVISAIIFFILGCGVFIVIGSTAPSDFPHDTIITIPKNIGISETAYILKNQNIIRSEFLFKAYTVLLGGKGNIKAGEYLFDQAQSVLKITRRIITGAQGMSRIRVTIPEGLNAKEISKLLSKNIPGFASSTFVTLATPLEGYLSPDTYYFYTNVTPQEVMDTMNTEYQQKILTLQSAIRSFIAQTSSSKLKINEQDIVTLASIIEKEANSMTDRQIVAGILWKRLSIGMALQVDPPFHYFLGKDLSQLTTDDLKKESPYNLYLHTGLPPTPIDNPSLDAIIATISPTKTNYLFYLSGKDGVMHYATTFDGHVANKQKYLQ